VRSIQTGTILLALLPFSLGAAPASTSITARLLANGAPKSPRFEVLSMHADVVACQVGPHQFYLYREADQRAFLVDVEKRTAAASPRLTAIPEPLESVDKHALDRLRLDKRAEIPAEVTTRAIGRDPVPSRYLSFMRSARLAGFHTCAFPLEQLPSRVNFKVGDRDRTLLVELRPTANAPSWKEFQRFLAEPAESILQRMRDITSEAQK
jgi:hypothetical protein